MSQTIEITAQDIIEYIKLNGEIDSVIQEIAMQKITTQVAIDEGFSADISELQQAADHLRFMNKLEKAEDTKKWLENKHLTIDDFEKIMYNNVINGKISKHLFSDKVKPYFYEHKLDYAGAAIYEIILDNKELAMELYYEIQENETTFAEVAYQYIEDKELKRKGGYLGIVARKEMKPEVSAKVFAANSPELLKPIVTSKGVHLIRVEEIIQCEYDLKLQYQILSNLFVRWQHQKLSETNISVCL